MAIFGHILTLCRKELLVLLRDRQAAALLFGMPAVFILLLSLALKDIYNEKVGQSVAVVLEVDDQGELAAQLERTLKEQADLHLLPRPDGMQNAALFRRGEARAAIRVPDGFSHDARAFLDEAGAEFGPNRIEFETSPTLDASYRWLLEARLALVFMEIVQDELIADQRELGEQLDELGGILQTTMGKLEETVVELQDAVGQLENMGRLLEGTPEDFQEMAAAAMVEKRANDEAVAARKLLESQGVWSEQALIDDVAPGPARPVVYEPLFAPAASDATAPLDEGLKELRARADQMAQNQQQRRVIPEPTEDDGPLVAHAAERPREVPFLRKPDDGASTLPTPLQQTVPGWSLFAMFFLVVPLSQGLHRERNEGTLRRIRSIAVSPVAVVLGKFIPYVLVAMVQFAGMLAMGFYVVPSLSDLSLDVGAEPWVLAPITTACALAAAAYALLVAAWSRTPEQAAAFGATSIIVLALMGGVMVPHFVMPAFMQDAALASPLYWGHKAYLDVFLHGAGLHEVMTPLLVLGGFAFVCLGLASWKVVRT